MQNNIRIKLLPLLFVACLMVLNFSAVQAESTQDEPIVIRFSHVVSENSPKGLGAELFQRKVEEELGGKVTVEVYPLSEKFTDEEAILALLFGDLEMVAPSFSKFYAFSQSLAIFDQPFFFESVDEVHNFQQSSIGQKLLSSMENKGLKGLAYWDNGMRVLSANKAIRTPADLEGLTMRIEPSSIIFSQYRRWGSLPMPMPFKRLPDALKGGLVDGYENAWSNVYSRNLHKLRPYFTDLNHSYLGYMVATSTEFWDGLPPAIRTTLEKILEEVRLEVRRIAADKVTTDRQKVLASDGVDLINPSAEERKLWSDAVLPLWKSFEASVGEELATAMINAKSGN